MLVNSDDIVRQSNKRKERKSLLWRIKKKEKNPINEHHQRNPWINYKELDPQCIESIERESEFETRSLRTKQLVQ